MAEKKQDAKKAYTVGNRLMHNGNMYEPGEVVELTANEFKALKGKAKLTAK